MAVVYFDDHPVWKTIQEYKHADRIQSQIAFMVYMDLCEDKGWWNVKTHACEELSVVFLSGHASRNKPREVILPVSVNTSLSHAQIQKYIHAVRLPEYPTDSLILALCGDDSSTVYFKVTAGLVPPEHPQLTDWKKYRREEMPDLRRHHVTEQTNMYMQKLREGNAASSTVTMTTSTTAVSGPDNT